MRSGISLLVALIVALALVGEARADKTREAKKLLDKGVELLDKHLYDEARTTFRRVTELVPDKPNPYRLLGMAEAGLHNYAEAVKDFDEFLQLAKKDDERRAEVERERARCKDELAPKIGTVVIDSTPTAAELRLDTDAGPPLGLTPYKNAQIPVGSHVAYVSKSGYQDASKVFTISKGDTVRLEVALTVQPPAVTTSPVDNPVTTAPPSVEKKKPKYWIIGVVGGVLAAGGIGVGLGLGLTQSTPAEAAFPSVAGF